MTFFDKQQEVMDIRLTRYGKYLLSKGSFKPEYYQFFDDDILYDSSCGGFSEKQNDTHNRITKNTPRLKTQSLTVSLNQSFLDETEKIKNKEREIFQSFSHAGLSLESEKILLYPLGSQNSNTINAPTFSLRSRSAPITNLTYSKLQESGIQKNIPILHIKSTYSLIEDRENLKSPEMFNSESFVDITGPEITFRDNSKLKVNSKKIHIDLQEINAENALETFKLEIFEVITDPEGNEKLIKIDKMEEVNKYFHIKTDHDVDSSIDYTGKRDGFYKRGSKR